MDEKMNFENDIDMDDEDVEIIDDLCIDENVFDNDSDFEDDEEEKKEKDPKKKKHEMVKREMQMERLSNTIFKGVDINTCTDDELKNVFDKLKVKWIMEDFHTVKNDEMIKKWSVNYNIQSYFDTDSLEQNYKTLYSENLTLIKYFKLKNIINTGDLQDPYILEFKKITFIIDYSYKVLSGMITSRRFMDPTLDTLSNLEDTFFRCSSINVSKIDDYQQLLLYLLEMLSYEQCMRYQGYVCKQKYIDGRATHYWEKMWKIEEFIEEYTDIHNHFKMWQIREKGGNHNNAIDYLKNKQCKPYFSDMVRSDGVYAFRNGLYNCRHVLPNGKPMWKFYEYSGDEVIPQELFACKFFDMEFDAHKYTPAGTTDNWHDIPSEHFDKLTIYQFQIYKGHCEDIYDFLLVLLGRLMAPLREWDKWEVFPFLVGLAGCGKSMILLEVVAKLFEVIDIGNLQDSNEGKFAYAPFAKKKIVMSTEIKKSFNTPATLFQQLISGEFVTLASKGEVPVEMRWTAPIILGGNELFNLADKGGSIARRTVTFPFYRKVKEEDKIMDMDERLTKNIGNLLHKMTCAYLEKLHKIGNDSIWRNIPPFFITQRERVTQETNSFYGFMNTKSLVEYKETYCCSMDVVKFAYKNYCKVNSLIYEPLRPDVYLAPFADMGHKLGYDICVEHDVKKESVDEDGNVVKDKKEQDYVIGLRLVE